MSRIRGIGFSKRAKLSRLLLIHGHHTTLRNPSPCPRACTPSFLGRPLGRMVPPYKWGALHAGTTSLRFVRRRITECCVKSWSVGKVGRFASSAKSLPRRSRASPPALRTALRPTSFDEAGKRIGHLFRRLQSVSSRFAAGRLRP
mgnify:CR=1 FL=1